MDVRVDGKVALVTGASRGIGEAIARELVASGVEGIVLTGRKPDPLADLASSLGSVAVAVPGNASDDAHVSEAVATAIDRFGRLDILVNNAGTNPVAGPIMDADPGAIDKTWAVNQRAPLMFARAAWTASMRDHGGAIINIGSIGGLRPSPALGAYNVSKAALHHLTRQLAYELAPGVRVNAIAGGVIKTKFSSVLWEWDPDAAAETQPLGRLGEPDDVAKATVFLCSDAASWITGVVLAVDGGADGAGFRAT